MRTVSVYGLGVAGVAAAKAFAERGIGVRLGDDSITDDMVALADAIDGIPRRLWAAVSLH